MELATDDGAVAELIERYPEALRFWQLLLPGTPWDIPVNVPAWTRRISQDAWNMKDPDYGKAISDTVSYAFGVGRAPADVLDALGQNAGLVQSAVQMATGEYQTLEEEKQAAKTAPDPTRRLYPGANPLQ